MTEAIGASAAAGSVAAGARGQRDNDEGSVAVWVLTCGALLLTLALITAIRSLGVLARHRAESAADLAALAAAGRIGVIADDICPAAGRAAAANRAAVGLCDVSLDPSGRSGTVRVRVALPFELPLLGEQSVAASARAGRLAVPP